MCAVCDSGIIVSKFLLLVWLLCEFVFMGSTGWLFGFLSASFQLRAVALRLAAEPASVPGPRAEAAEEETQPQPGAHVQVRQLVKWSMILIIYWG